MKEDSYNFISEAAAKAAMGLSLSLTKNKKVVCSKFNSNLCTHVSTNYQVTEIKLNEHVDSVRLEGSYMGGICMYIEAIGASNPDYLKESWKYFLQENMEAKDGKAP